MPSPRARTSRPDRLTSVSDPPYRPVMDRRRFLPPQWLVPWPPRVTSSLRSPPGAMRAGLE